MSKENIGSQTKVFISYSSVDRPFAERIVADFKRHGIHVWYDAWEMKVGDSLTRKIQDGIQESSYLAIVLSPNSVKSRWVRVELQAALNKEIERDSVFVLPILYKKCDLPAFLSDKIYADFSSDYHKGFQQLLLSLGRSVASATVDENELLSKITMGLMVEKLGQFSALELSSLISMMEDRFGIPAAAEDAPSEESSREVVPEDILAFLSDGQKVAAIKRYRQIHGCGLKEAMDAVEGIQKTLKTPYSAGVGDDLDVATKIELAQAYEEMGDHEGARELLGEIASEGSARQCAYAQQKLRQLE